MKVKRRKPRSAWAQKARMDQRWPQFEIDVAGRDALVWTGWLRGFQMAYTVSILWEFGRTRPPLAYVLSPRLRPRKGGTMLEIPHLIFDRENPELSALCLFDPEGGEWDPTMLIADTTIPWASEWLHHYELWRVDGVWRGPNAPGPISVAAMIEEKEAFVDGARP